MSASNRPALTHKTSSAFQTENKRLLGRLISQSLAEFYQAGGDRIVDFGTNGAIDHVDSGCYIKLANSGVSSDIIEERKKILTVYCHKYGIDLKNVERSEGGGFYSYDHRYCILFINEKNTQLLQLFMAKRDELMKQDALKASSEEKPKPKAEETISSPPLAISATLFSSGPPGGLNPNNISEESKKIQHAPG